jgi:IS5 family transposase
VAADQGTGFEQYRRPTKRDGFLKTMNENVPWSELCEVIKPHYARGEGGRDLDANGVRQLVAI